MKAAVFLFALLSFAPAWCQQQKIVIPLTAGDLKQLCKSYDLVVLEIDLKKAVAWQELNAASSCLNYIIGVLGTIAAMDVGLFPQLRYELADSHKPIPYKEYVAPFMKCIAGHPEYEKEPAASVVALSLMEAKILIPKHWEEKKP
ncbi:MAG TPA: hypothetical protein VKW06_08880 [Candidatus Angelobacter sp.]|nr:hypothetical protein [Candidatus Angelobacter sp.]